MATYNFLDKTGLGLVWAKIKALIVQSDWDETDSTDPSYIQSRPAIRAGEGENSIIEGQIEDEEDAAIYTLLISGNADATTYSYTTQDTLPSKALLKNYGAAKFTLELPAATTSGIRKIEDIDANNALITFDKTISSTTELTNHEIQILYKTANIAINDSSHAEGNGTVAAGSYSHSEGNKTFAIASSAHAEGLQTLANANSSHAEGAGTTASGIYSHAEGSNTIASGSRSHAEGNNTIASSGNQHVQGKYNIEDADNVYADIVGNGSSSTRSNAYTLDWNGNGVYAGKVTVGVGPTNNMDVATKQYVDNAIPTVPDALGDLTDTAISSPSNGQILKYNSTTSKWENSNIPAGATVTLNGSTTTTPSFYAPTTAGTSGQVLKSNGSGAPTWQAESAQNGALSISSNVITLTNASGTTSSITLPIYNGGVQTV